MSIQGALNYREVFQRLNQIGDGFKTEEKRRKQQTCVRHLQRVDKTGTIGRKPDGKPMLGSISVKREGEEKSPVEINALLKNLGVDRGKFWGPSA